MVTSAADGYRQAINASPRPATSPPLSHQYAAEMFAAGQEDAVECNSEASVCACVRVHLESAGENVRAAM